MPDEGVTPFKVKIDQLPEELIEAADPREAALRVAALLDGHDRLRKLADDEPVQIKRADGTPWGRNLTIGDFRSGLADHLEEAEVQGDGPSRDARP